MGAAVRGTRGTWQRHAQGARNPPSSEQDTQPDGVGFNADWTWPYQGEP